MKGFACVLAVTLLVGCGAPGAAPGQAADPSRSTPDTSGSGALAAAAPPGEATPSPVPADASTVATLREELRQSRQREHEAQAEASRLRTAQLVVGQVFRMFYQFLSPSGPEQVLRRLLAPEEVTVWDNTGRPNKVETFSSSAAVNLNLLADWISAHPLSDLEEVTSWVVLAGNEPVYMQGRWPDGQWFVFRMAGGRVTGLGVQKAPMSGL